MRWHVRAGGGAAARLVVLEDLGARAHLPSALGTDDVVLGGVLALVHLEPQLHVAHRVVGLRRRGRTRRSHTHGVTQAQAQESGMRHCTASGRLGCASTVRGRASIGMVSKTPSP